MQNELADPEMYYGAPYLLMCRGDLHVKARRRARLGLRVRCLADAIAPAQFLAPSSNCRDTPCTCLPMSALG